MRTYPSRQARKRAVRGQGATSNPWLSRLIQVFAKRDAVIVRFCVRFLALLSVFIAAIIVMRISGQRIEAGIDAFTARATVYVLKAFSLEAERYQSQIYAHGLPFDIIIECTGLYTACLYLACVLAFPASFKRKAAGCALGLLAIFIVNVIRLVTLVLIAVYRPQLSDLAHYYIWDASFIVLVIILFQIWVDGIVKGAADKLIFLAKFLGFSIALFLFVVYVVKDPYQRLLTNVVQAFFGKSRHFDQNNVPLIANRIYNLVAFVSLMFSTSRIPLGKKVKYTAIGLLIIFIYHCWLSVSANLQSFQNLTGLYRVSLESISLIIYFALPLLLWLYFTYRYTLKKLKPVETDVIIPGDPLVCPYCGRRKRGLAKHIRAVHGQTGVR